MFTAKIKSLMAGGIATVLLATFLLGGIFTRPTNAQPPQVGPPAAQAPAGRYQISSFGYRWGDGSTCGAYILDTQAGEVFQVVGKNAPEKIGTVAQTQPKR